MRIDDREARANPFAEISPAIMLHEFQSRLQIKIVQNWPPQLAEFANFQRFAYFAMRISK